MLTTTFTFSGFETLALAAEAARSEQRASKPLPQIRREDVIRIYSGKHGCMCGCMGRYYCPASTPEALREGADVSEAQVTRILNVMNAQPYEVRRMEGVGLGGEIIVSLETGRNLVAYLRPTADVSGFEVEQ